MFQFFLLSVTVIIGIVIANSDDNLKIIVETKTGQVRGKLFKTLYDQRPYYAFKGIPYAEAPVDNLRFKVSKINAPIVRIFFLN